MAPLFSKSSLLLALLGARSVSAVTCPSGLTCGTPSTASGSILYTSFSFSEIESAQGCADRCLSNNACKGFYWAEFEFCTLYSTPASTFSRSSTSNFAPLAYDIGCFADSTACTPSSVSSSSTQTPVPSPSLCPTPGQICNVPAVASTLTTSLGSENGGTSVLSPQLCAGFCEILDGCAGFFFRQNLICELFSGPASKSSTSSPGSANSVYDLGCFQAPSSPCPVSSMTSSSSIQSTLSNQITTSVSITSVNPPVFTQTSLSSSTALSSSSIVYLQNQTSAIYTNTTSSAYRSKTMIRITHTRCHTVTLSSKPTAGISSFYSNATLSQNPSRSKTLSLKTHSKCANSTKLTSKKSTPIASASATLVFSSIPTPAALQSTTLPIYATPTALSTTSTIYSTIVSTISACPSSVTNCPVGSVVTKTIAVSTTVCPVAKSETTSPLPAGYTTSTIYSTQTSTILKCPATITNCPVGQVVTKTIAISTTICPIAEAEGTGTKGATLATGAISAGGSTLIVGQVASASAYIAGATSVPVGTSAISSAAGSPEVGGSSAGIATSALGAASSIVLVGSASPSTASGNPGGINPPTSSSPTTVSSATTIAISSVSAAEATSVKGSATTSSGLVQVTGNAAARATVGWPGLGVAILVGGFAVL